MLRFLKAKCYAVVAYAPASSSIREADLAFNRFIENPEYGVGLYHDHFVGAPGGVAIYYVESQQELDGLGSHRALETWDVKIHPLTFTEKPLELLYQMDFTLGVYRGRWLKDLIDAYRGSKYELNVDEHMKKRP